MIKVTDSYSDSIVHFRGLVTIDQGILYLMTKHWCPKEGYEIDFYGIFNWPEKKITICIGDYIIASWLVFSEDKSITFNNAKGYANGGILDAIDELPVQIVDEVMSIFRPKM